MIAQKREPEITPEQAPEIPPAPEKPDLPDQPDEQPDTEPEIVPAEEPVTEPDNVPPEIIPSQKSTATLLNDLITINKNRITGYKEAIHFHTNDNEIKPTALFKEMIRQSGHYLAVLEEKLKAIGEEVRDKTTTSGILYNTWMDILYAKADDARPDNKTFCTQLEETALKAYESVYPKLMGTSDMSDLVNSQKEGIRHSFELVKQL